MLALDDTRWTSMHGGYRLPYDARPALAHLATGDSAEAAWQELWNELHHQGDVGEASYAAVPHLVCIHRKHGVADWNTYALVACVEISRHRGQNPPLPDWLRSSYEAALSELAKMAMRDLEASDHPLLVRSALGVIALAKGLPEAAEMILDFDENELREVRRAYEGA